MVSHLFYTECCATAEKKLDDTTKKLVMTFFASAEVLVIL